MIYSIHGLIFSSEQKLSLPEVPKSGNIDVSISFSNINSSSLKLSDSSANTVFFKSIDPQNILISIPKIAKFQVIDGNTIFIDPYNQSLENWPAIELYLFGSIIGIILSQRNLFAFHSNAVLIKNKGVLIAGDSGVGKSTTAAIFQQKGYEVLCDDIVVVNEDLCINGEFPKIKLWSDSLDKLNIPHSNLDPVATQEGKFHYPLTRQKKAKHVQIEISHFYILSTSNELKTIKMKAIKGVNQFQALLSNTYRNEFIAGLGIQKHHLDICSKLAEKISITQIKRPVTHFSGYEIVDMIIQDIDNKNTR